MPVCVYKCLCVCVCLCVCMVMMMSTFERHLPTPEQRGHSLQRHTAAGTAAPTTIDTGKHKFHSTPTPLKRPMRTPQRGPRPMVS